VTALDKYLGSLAKDLPAETMQQLVEEGYSISPRSGRIRIRFRHKESSVFYKKKRVKRYARIVF